ncbi:MAG: iron-sulfur cluster assembly scaffold protein [bacterium]
MIHTRPTSRQIRDETGYPAVTILNYVSPLNEGVLPQADARGYAGSDQDDEWLEISLALSPELVVTEARFRAVGCPALIAAGSMLTQLVRGRSLSDTHFLTAAELDRALGHLPDLRRYAASIAVKALQQAAAKVWESRPPVLRHAV